jgi:hypothetical protein
MATPLLHLGATVLCAHGGQATPTVPDPRVCVNGQPIVTLSTTYVVAGCSLVPPPIPPCVSAQWVRGATRITAGGVPVLLMDGQAICTPTGTPLVPVVTQTRVLGT